MKTVIEFEIEITKDDDGYNCYVPDVDCFFHAETQEEINKKAYASIKAFINFYNQMNKDSRITINPPKEHNPKI